MSEATDRVETHFLTIATPEQPFELRGGKQLKHAQIAYETYGTLNDDKSNAILLFHALSGSHHAQGYNPEIPGTGDLWQPEMHQGWWEDFIGPGKAIDTDKFFIISANYLGGCYGSTGPASIDPETGKPFGSKFPHLWTTDVVNSQLHLLEHFGIEQLHATIGTSVGGLMALTLATRYPEKVRKVVPMLSGFKTTILNRLLLFEQIMAIENDKEFNGGDYYEGNYPNHGLALARMISHKTFVHLDTFERRAKADKIEQPSHLDWYDLRDQYQSYMLYQGMKFVKRFDANTYLRIIDLWSRFDAVAECDKESPEELLQVCKDAGHQFLVFSVDSDFCFYPEEQAVLVKNLELVGVDNMHITVHSDKGHDSFLLEPNLYTPHLKAVLED